MAKGTALTLENGATNEEIFECALRSKEKQMKSVAGWFGVITVNVNPSDDGAKDGETCLVKVRTDGLDLFRVAARMKLVTKLQRGKVTAV